VAIKALEFAGVLTWQNRITRIRERRTDLFGRSGWRWRVIRTSNAYVLGLPGSKSENPTGTQIQEVNPTLRAPDPASKASIEVEQMAPEVRQAAHLVLDTVRQHRMRALGLA
jgi:hypothetical protein